MGVPSFYKWLVERYPRAVVAAEEETPVVANGVTLPIDSSLPNPNGFEFDNLYLDMNCIIHPCFHPEDLPPPSTYDEIFVAVFKYIDRLFSIVRPRKLLYLAIDGVAPRAKMNQQRSRRFRAAKEAADAALMEEELGTVVEKEQKKSNMDSNIITPGTEFMDLLSSALRYYVHLRMNTDSGWKGIKLIISDASVPGEGEHKIMSYIRLQRNLPGFDPNTRHCLYGLDADLIFLALATHEIHFTILREDVRWVQNFKKSKNVKELKEGLAEQEGFAKHIEDYVAGIDFQFLKIWVLREYLAYDMRIPDSMVKMDLERLIDDFVFMCLFVGNDFLPHIPSLEIPEGALDLLMMVYKREFVRMGGYLTNSYEINLERVEHFVQSVGHYESAIFRKRNGIQKGYEARVKRPKKSGQISNAANGITGCKIEKSLQVQEVIQYENVVVDKIMLGEEGWKERFYMEKFDAKTEEERERIRKDAVLKYVEGISWVMQYYYDGVCSWQWFYPYHYAPFASDFHGLSRLEIHFTLGRPFKPFDQLMGVLPAASAHVLPLSYRKLMTDGSSPLLDFYPADFEVDLNGKRFSWLGVCKLPFIDESRLLLEMAKVEHTLTDDEKRRNSLGLDILFIHMSHPLAFIVPLFQPNNHSKLPEEKIRQKIDPKISGGLNGYIHVSDETVRPVEVHSPVEGMPAVLNNCVISVLYSFPEFHPHIPRLPEGVIVPVKSVSKNSILPPNTLWHETTIRGRVFDRRPIQNSVSGSGLAKLCYWLLSKYHQSKQQEGAAGIKPSLSTNTGKLENVGTTVKADEKENKPKRKRKQGSENKNNGAAQNGILKANAQEGSPGARSKTNRRRRKSKGKNQGGGRSNVVAQNDTKLNGYSSDKKLVSSIPIEGVDAPNNNVQEKRTDHGEGRANAQDAYQEVQPNSRKRKRKTKNGKAAGGTALKKEDVKSNGSNNNRTKRRHKKKRTAVMVST